MNVILFIVAGVVFAVSIRYAYWSWFKTESYIEMTRKQRRKFRKNLPFMPQVLMFNFYDRNPKIEIAIMRIVSLLFMGICLLAIIVSIKGPIHLYK